MGETVPKVELISYTPQAESLLIRTKNTRLLHEESPTLKMTMEDMEKELDYMSNTIPSSWEFVSYTFLIKNVSRAFTHQFVRTRNGSYAQQSMRVVDKSDFDYVYTKRNLDDPRAYAVINEVLEKIKWGYRTLIEMDQPVEDARGILPTNISTNIVAKFNLRTLSELAASRTGGRTQNEYQEVMNRMADEVIKVHPWAEKFLFKKPRDYFKQIEEFAEEEYGGDLLKKGKLLKIVDQMRKEK